MRERPRWMSCLPPASAVFSPTAHQPSGVLLGMLSTHYRTPMQPADRDLRVLDLLARQAADAIEEFRLKRRGWRPRASPSSCSMSFLPACARSAGPE